jgi:UDP-N-acetyl-D-glucosamine/UDP-N-acetyl-D-galactosamine dehydrogenase
MIFMTTQKKEIKLAIIGLGYVGLPLALEFAKKRKVIGYDINESRVKALIEGIDKNQEFIKEEIEETSSINFTSNLEDLKLSNCYIVTVPTPVDLHNKPDLSALKKASKMVANILKKRDIVIYESTVYPGCVEEECVPILEKFSELKFNNDFFCGYSPERINPGDKEHVISNIKKITSGSTPDSAELIDKLYNEIITVGTHKAPSIKVAEAAKVIENTQRDLNIALINELSILFSKMNIDTQAVLEAAGSKWNFLPFKPGLVGGHCIGVDPYYLTYKAESIGYKPKVILAGRETNDRMGAHIVSVLIAEMERKNIPTKGSNILVMGLTFKENCTDIRNSGTEKVISELKKFDCNIELYDPLANREEIKETYGVYPNTKLNQNTYDGIIIATAHETFKTMGAKAIKNLCKKNHIIYDLKSLFSKEEVDLRL